MHLIMSSGLLECFCVWLQIADLNAEAIDVGIKTKLFLSSRLLCCVVGSGHIIFFYLLYKKETSLET